MIAVVLGASGDDIVAILSAHVKTQTTTFCLHWRAAVAASCGGPWQDVCGGGGGVVVSLRLPLVGAWP